MTRLEKKGALRRRLDRAAGCDSGGVTVEFALWVPIFAMILLGLTDISLNVAYRSNVERATMETVFALSRRQITADEAETYLRDRILVGNPASVNVTATFGAEAEVIVTKADQSAIPITLYEQFAEPEVGTTIARSSMLAEIGDDAAAE